MRMLIPAALNAALAAANLWAFYRLGGRWWNLAASITCALSSGFSIGVLLERLYPFVGVTR